MPEAYKRCPSTLNLAPEGSAPDVVQCGAQMGHSGMHVVTSADGVLRLWIVGITPGATR